VVVEATPRPTQQEDERDRQLHEEFEHETHLSADELAQALVQIDYENMTHPDAPRSLNNVAGRIRLRHRRQEAAYSSGGPGSVGFIAIPDTRGIHAAKSE